ncbi:MAG: PilZ domain-containing protein [Candidatus Omnitrophica bacterium]|nr:PilZ domain-containing protein [Candidatus Omnitrophota bacterium]
MIEKRKFIRLNAPIGVTYKVITGNKAEAIHLSLVKNISGGGVRIAAKDLLKNGDLLDLKIQIPHLRDPIHAIGEVVWFSERREGERDLKEAGVRFRDIEACDLHCILEYVHTIGIG